LSPEEIASRRERGLCLNCEEKFQRGYHCASRVFLLIVDEDNPTPSNIPIFDPPDTPPPDPPDSSTTACDPVKIVVPRNHSLTGHDGKWAIPGVPVCL